MLSGGIESTVADFFCHILLFISLQTLVRFLATSQFLILILISTDCIVLIVVYLIML